MIKSKKPSKQRKYRAKAPTHVRRKIMSSHLSPELRKKHKKRSTPVRKGDEVIIMRGSFKGTKGKVEEVNRKRYKVFVENIFYEKKDGTKTKIGIDTSNLMITSLNLDDPKRFKGDLK
jgi:large subunit ribosomal protein L24